MIHITIHSGPFSHPFKLTLGEFVVPNNPPGGRIHMGVRGEKTHVSGLTWNFCIRMKVMKCAISRPNVKLLYS